VTAYLGANPAAGELAGGEVLEHTFKAMGTDVHVIVVGGTPAHIALVETIVADREARWTRFDPDSELMRLNRHTGVPVMVSQDTFQLIEAAVEASHLTGGAFDPTVLGSLVAAGYSTTFGDIDGDRQVENVAPHGVDGIRLDPVTNMVVLPPETGIDLGGIAKGATAEFAASEVLKWGAEGCCVNIGGDLQVQGRGPGPEGWVIEIDCAGSDASRWVGLAHGAVCTSTVSKRRWDTESGPQHHIRDTVSGGPLESGVASITVIGRSAIQAEVLTKAAMAAGVEGAEPLVTGHGATGMAVTSTGRIIEFDGFNHFELHLWNNTVR